MINLRSKTHKATVALSVLGSLMTFFPTVREFIPAEYYGPIIVVIGVAFHVLRNMTTQPIKER